MKTHALAIALASLVPPFGASALAAQGSGDGCALLQPAEIQALAGSAKVATPTAKTFVGMDASLVRQAILAGVKPNDPNSEVIPGVGDAAVSIGTLESRRRR